MATTGRPREYKSPEELQQEIDAYFELVEVEGKNATISGLVYYLGFSSRSSFYEYERREEFSHTIKRARLRIEGRYEDRLYQKNAAGPIFALKNLGWTDRQEIHHEGLQNPVIKVHIEKPANDDDD